jgi:hypothetical protein
VTPKQSAALASAPDISSTCTISSSPRIAAKDSSLKQWKKKWKKKGAHFEWRIKMMCHGQRLGFSITNQTTA